MPCSLHSLKWVALPPGTPKLGTHFPHEHFWRLTTSPMPCSLQSLQWVALLPGIPKPGIHFPHDHLRRLPSCLTSTMPCSLHSLQWVALPPGVPKPDIHFPYTLSESAFIYIPEITKGPHVCACACPSMWLHMSCPEVGLGYQQLQAAMHVVCSVHECQLRLLRWEESGKDVCRPGARDYHKALGTTKLCMSSAVLSSCKYECGYIVLLVQGKFIVLSTMQSGGAGKQEEQQKNFLSCYLAT